jgi:hypothetical protein
MPRKKIDPILSTFEKHLGPADGWAGCCFGIATGAVEKKLVPKGSVAVYGHWKGDVHPESMFFAASGWGFVQHGWVQKPDGTVCDPTRWVFEHVKPYIYDGPADHYDVGGNALRMRMLGSAPEYDPNDPQFHLNRAILPGPAWTFVERLLGLHEACLDDGPEPGTVSYRQLAWLANHDPAVLGQHAPALYAALDTLRLRGLVPIDNWMMVERRMAQTSTPLPKRRKA